VVVQGAGVESQAAVVNEPASFLVDTSCAGVAQLDVAVVNTNDCDTLDVSVVRDDADTSLYNCRYTPRDAVKHTVIVTYGHVSVPHSPFKVHISTSSSSSSQKFAVVMLSWALQCLAVIVNSKTVTSIVPPPTIHVKTDGT